MLSNPINCHFQEFWSGLELWIFFLRDWGPNPAIKYKKTPLSVWEIGILTSCYTSLPCSDYMLQERNHLSSTRIQVNWQLFYYYENTEIYSVLRNNNGFSSLIFGTKVAGTNEIKIWIIGWRSRDPILEPRSLDTTSCSFAARSEAHAVLLESPRMET